VLQDYYRIGVGQHLDVADPQWQSGQWHSRHYGSAVFISCASSRPTLGLAVGVVADQSCFPMKGGVPTNAALAPGVDEREEHVARVASRPLTQRLQ
jgi:hypothetical protein